MPSLAIGGNGLLKRAGAADLVLIAQRGVRKSFVRNDVLHPAHLKAPVAYFIENGVASVVKRHANKRSTEICLVGSEGFTGACVVQADGQSPYETFVQSEVLDAICVEADVLANFVELSPAFHRALLTAIHVQTVQIAENLAAAVWERTTVRLARWLMMYHDRVGSPKLEVTHEFMAMMIGAQRTRVTTALHVIEAEGAIATGRGIIIVKEAAVLQRLANGTYGAAEAESKRLLQPPPSPAVAAPAAE